MNTQTQPFHQLIEEGRVCPPKFFCPAPDFTPNVGYNGICHLIVEPYRQHCNGKKAIVYCVNTAHAEATVSAFNSNGIWAAAILGTHSKPERDRTIERFRRGELLVLVNVSVLLDDFRRPEVDAVIMADPTNSRSKFFQQVAAALAPRFAADMPTLTSDQRRAAIEASDKPHGLVIDPAGNVMRHGLADFDHSPRSAQPEAEQPERKPMTTVLATKLTGPALAYAVAIAEGLAETLDWCFRPSGLFGNIWTDDHGCYRPDEDGAMGMELIHKHKVWLSPPCGNDQDDEPYGWDAEIYAEDGNRRIGHAIGCPTALVAICRAVVLAKLGDAVQVPEELTRD